MKKKVVLLICLLFLSGCYYDPYEIPEEVSINLNENIFEIYNDINTKDFIKDSNVEFTNHKIIDAKKLGENTYTLKFKYKKKNYKYKVTYEVKDVNAPIIVSAPSSKTVLVNDAYFPCSSIVYIDDVDSNPECIVSGEYDLTTPGNYDIKLSVHDASGNIKEHNMKLNVVTKLPQSNSGGSSNTTRLDFQTVINRYKRDNTLVGIDVSFWQGDIDFEKVKNAGCDFVIMRMGIMSDIDKDLSLDSYYIRNIAKAKNAGLKVGVYIYTSAINAKMAKSDAEWIVENLNGEKLDFPVAYDWENWSKLMKYHTTIHDMEEALTTFHDILHKNGYETMLYSSKFYLKNVWQNKNKYPVWLAHYVNETDYTGDYIMWQISDRGRIDGVNGNVDIDIYYQK